MQFTLPKLRFVMCHRTSDKKIYSKRFQCDVFAFGSYAPEARR